MKKNIQVFDIQAARPSWTELYNKIRARRLKRRQETFEGSDIAAEWLHHQHTSSELRLAFQGIDGDDVDLDLVGEMIGAAQLQVSDHPKYPRDIGVQEGFRLEKWCKGRIEKMALPGRSLPAKMPPEEKKEIQEAAADMQAVYLTEHEIDVAFSAIHRDFPWLGGLTEKVWLQARKRARSGLPAGVGPMLLVGPPGIGKSSWARAVADYLGVPDVAIDAGATGGVFELQGHARGWGGAERGRVIGKMISERVANPLVVLDEIDAGASQVGIRGGGALPGLFKVMMSLVEPSTARSWVCPYYQVPVDMTNVSWIATSNSISSIEKALLDRMTIIRVPDLTGEQLLAYAEHHAQARVGYEAAHIVTDHVKQMTRDGRRVSLRHVQRLIQMTEDHLERPTLQ